MSVTNRFVEAKKFKLTDGAAKDFILKCKGIGGDAKWVSTSEIIEGTTALADLSDVAISGATTDQALIYNGSSWVNGSAGASNLNELSDVTLSGVTSGDSLTYNGTTWVNGTPVSALNDLTDVTLSGAVSDDVLVYNGSNWVNDATIKSGITTNTSNITTNTNSITVLRSVYDAIVHPTASEGDYQTISAAVTAGAKNIFVSDGNYDEVANIEITNGTQITGQSRDGVIVNLNPLGTPYAVTSYNNGAGTDGDAVSNGAGTITVTNNSAAITTFSGSPLFTTNTAAEQFIQIQDEVYEILSVADDDNLTLKEPFQGTTATGVSYRIIEAMPDKMGIYNITFRNAASFAIEVAGSRNFTVENCEFESCCSVADFAAINVIDSRSCIIRDCRYSESGAENFFVNFVNALYGKISNCEVRDMAAGGVRLVDSRHTLIEKCSFINAPSTASGVSFTSTLSVSTTINECVFRNGFGSTAAGVYATGNDLAQRTVITKCLFEDCLADAINLQNNDEMLVDNCDFKNIDGQGIDGGSIGTTYSTVSNSRFFTVNGAVRIRGNYIQIRGNDFVSAGTVLDNTSAGAGDIIIEGNNCQNCGAFINGNGAGAINVTITNNRATLSGKIIQQGELRKLIISNNVFVTTIGDSFIEFPPLTNEKVLISNNYIELSNASARIEPRADMIITGNIFVHTGTSVSFGIIRMRYACQDLVVTNNAFIHTGTTGSILFDGYTSGTTNNLVLCNNSFRNNSTSGTTNFVDLSRGASYPQVTFLGNVARTASGGTAAWDLDGGANVTILRDSYDAYVHPELGDYKTISGAVSAGRKNIFVSNGTYTESAAIALTSDVQITGESREGVIINFDTSGSFVSYNNGAAVDGDSVAYVNATISVTNNSTAVTGSGFAAFSDGQYISIGPEFYQIDTITDASNLTLSRPYLGDSMTYGDNGIGYLVIDPPARDIHIRNITCNVTSDHAIDFSGVSGVIIENCYFYHDSTVSDWRACVNLVNCERSQIRNCHFEGGTNLVTTGDGSSSIFLDSSLNCVITDCYFSKMKRWMLLFRRVQYLKVDNCTFANCGIETSNLGYSFFGRSGNGNSEYIQISNCNSHGMGNLIYQSVASVYYLSVANCQFSHSKYGFALNTTYYLSMDNCIFRDIASPGGIGSLYLIQTYSTISNCYFDTPGTQVSFNSGTSSDCTITGCTFENGTTSLSAAPALNLRVIGCLFKAMTNAVICGPDTKVSDCTFKTCTTAINTGTSTTIQDCTFDTCATPISCDAANVIVTNCLFDSGSGANPAIACTSAASNVLISSNTFVNNTNRSILLTQTENASIVNNKFSGSASFLIEANGSASPPSETLKISGNVAVDGGGSANAMINVSDYTDVVISNNNITCSNASQCLLLDTCYNITVTGNNFKTTRAGSFDGLIFLSCDRLLLSSNVVTVQQFTGIYIFESSNITVTSNNVKILSTANFAALLIRDPVSSDPVVISSNVFENASSATFATVQIEASPQLEEALVLGNFIVNNASPTYAWDLSGVTLVTATTNSPAP